MIHHQALQDFPCTSQVLLHKNNKINLPVPKMSWQVKVEFWFISKHSVAARG
jgi:hypothetical protein